MKHSTRWGLAIWFAVFMAFFIQGVRNLYVGAVPSIWIMVAAMITAAIGASLVVGAVQITLKEVAERRKRPRSIREDRTGARG